MGSVVSDIGKAIGLDGLDTSIKDPAGMQQYTDIANQAQQGYANNQKFLNDTVNPYRTQLLQQMSDATKAQQGPSIVDAQLKGAFDKSLAQQLAMARSQRGVNPGLAARNVANATAQTQQNLAQEGVIGKLQEQQNFQNQQERARAALANQVAGEQNYNNNMLSAAMGGQQNVATMQQQQRAANDTRNANIFGQASKIVGSAFGAPFAKGGSVPGYAGGGYVYDPVNTGGNMNAYLQAMKAYNAAQAQGNEALSGIGGMKLPKFGATPEQAPAALDSGILQNQMMPTMPMLDSGAIMAASKGGPVKGDAINEGDSSSNDTVHAKLSPGEVVVPRTVVAQGPVAAAYFVKQASKDDTYNVDNFHAEKKSFASMLKDIQQKDEDYKKFKKLVKKGV